MATEAERRPRRGAGHAVGGQAVGALEGAQRPRGAGTEHAVRGDAEPALEEAHRAAVRGVVAAMGPVRRAAGLQQGMVAPHAERGPGRGTGDAVGCQAMGALEALERALRAWAEDAVGRDPEMALQQAHGTATRPARAGG